MVSTLHTWKNSRTGVQWMYNNNKQINDNNNIVEIVNYYIEVSNKSKSRTTQKLTHRFVGPYYY